MHMNIDLKLYPQRRKPHYIAMILLIGATTTMWAMKLSTVLSIIIGAYWVFLLSKSLIHKTIGISETHVTTVHTIGSICITKKIIPLSNFYGVRNRIHWGHYKHCHTELIGSHGVFLPIRIELMTEKITPEAKELKELLVTTLKLESCRDLEHA